MKLVLVHGRSQEGQDPAELKRKWLDALQAELRLAGTDLPPGTKVEFPFYGDLLEDFRKEVDDSDPDVIRKGSFSSAEENFRREALLEIAAAAGITETDIEKEVNLLVNEKGPLNHAPVLAVLRLIDRRPKMSSFVIQLGLRDVFLYQSHPGVQAKINAIIEQAIGDEPCVLVTHSLGTIVAYNTLRDRRIEAAIPRLITLGSPLGLNAVQRFMPKPITMPPKVGHWFNAFDSLDLVALNPLEGASFAVTPEIENYGSVKNDTDNHHTITGYFNNAKIAARIREFL